MELNLLNDDMFFWHIRHPASWIVHFWVHWMECLYCYDSCMGDFIQYNDNVRYTHNQQQYENNGTHLEMNANNDMTYRMFLPLPYRFNFKRQNIFHHLSTLRWHVIQILLEGKHNPYILHIKYHGCRWLVYTRSAGITGLAVSHCPTAQGK